MNLKIFLQIIILSFHSSHLYLDVAKKWKHWGLGFLIRFSILTGITISASLFILVAASNFNQLSPILEQIPKLSIKNNINSIVGIVVVLNKIAPTIIDNGCNVNIKLTNIDA